MYPWPSFGSFLFKREESAHFETDAGWVLSPSYAQQRPIGSTTDYILATAIGSANRTFEITITYARFLELQQLLNTTATFTDWLRPQPDSRSAFLYEVTPLEQVSNVALVRKLRVRITLVSQNVTLVTP